MDDYHDKRFIRSLRVQPSSRTQEDLEMIYGCLRGMEALCWLREPALRALCHTVRYQIHYANDILYCRGELATCWYILLSGSVFIDGSMYLPRSSFGKRSGGGGRRANECLILEPSEMIVIDYPDVQLMRPGQRVSCNTMNLEKLMALEQDEITIRPGGRGAPPPPPGHHHHQYEADHHHHHLPHHHHSHHDTYLPDLVGSAILRGARSRGSVGSSVRDGSDTSSAYSGSDTMCHSLQSSLEPDDVDLSGLTESAVDSDEEDLAESIESLAVRDAVRECLEKDPSERTEDDIKVLLEFTQRLRAFSNMTLAVRKAMCQAMVFAVVEEAGTILMNHGEELDSWSVIINGHVEVTQPDGSVHELHLGDSFGITPTMEKLYHQGTMRSKVDDCQFVCIRQTDYYRILHQSEENIRRHEENGVLVLVTEQRPIDAGNRKGNIVIKGTAERLMHQLVEVENNVDPTYVEDFLLTHRTFIESPLVVANKLLQWFEDPSLRDRVTRVVLLWVNNHFTDFEMDPVMMNFLEQFEEGLEREKMAGQLRLLDFACATKARARTVTLTRPSRDEILHFSILGGYERGYGIFISKVEKGSKAEDVGLKRGDQILEVNGQSFDHMNHAKALEILRQTCHLSITVKSNLLAFKEMLTTPENSPRPRSRKSSDVRGIADINSHLAHNSAFTSAMNIPIDHIQQSPRDKGKVGNNKGSFMTTKANKLKKKVIESLMPKNNALDSQANSDDSVSSHSSVGGGLYHSQSNPDLSTTGTYDDVRTEFPEHVLKVYRATDQQARFLPVHKETTAREVVMLALQIFNINDPTGSSNYALYEVTVTEEGITKQKRLPDSLQNLAERIGLSSRYYLKNITVSQTLFPDDIVSELIRESTVYFLQLNSVELAIQLTLEDYTVFRQIEPTEYVDYLFNLKSNYGTPALSLFAELVNREMFWVVSEVTSEHNLVKRSKTVKQFIKVARQCKECKNFNSMFAILSGLGHGSVSRLKQTWERLPSKYQRMYHEMQELMDPSRNMSKYRNLVQNENIQSPIIPFYPVVARDLTFTHEGNDDKVEGLINFEKLRMISRYIRDLQNMCSAPYDLFNIQDAGGQPPSSALISLNQMAAGGHQIATVKRRKKSTAAPDKKKMYEEAQMVRRVKAYLSRMSIITDEEQLRNMSYECEGGSEGHKTAGGSVSHNSNSSSGSNSAPPTNPPPRKRPNSPTPSTTSSTSSTSQTSDGKKQTAKFGATSPQSISKMKALAEPKTKPHHGPRSTTTHHSLSPTPSPGPPRRGAMTNNNSRSTHERSHSDTHAVPVDLSAESSSVTSLSKLHKSHTSGMLLEPAPYPVRSAYKSTLPVNTVTVSSSTVVSSPSFVHAAACSALIASVMKLSTSSNNATRKSTSISNDSTPLVSIKNPKIKLLQKQKKLMLKLKHLSSSFDSSYNSNSGDSEPMRTTSSLPVHPMKAKKRLNSIYRYDQFSRSLPTPGTDPSQIDTSTIDFNLNIPDDNLECQISTPVAKVLPVSGIPNDTEAQNLKDLSMQTAVIEPRDNTLSHYEGCLKDEFKEPYSSSIQEPLYDNKDSLIFDDKIFPSVGRPSISNSSQRVMSYTIQKNTLFTNQKDISLPSVQDTSITRHNDTSYKDTFLKGPNQLPDTCQNDIPLNGLKDTSFNSLKMPSVANKKDSPSIHNDNSVLSLNSPNCNRKDLCVAYNNKASFSSQKLQNLTATRQKLANTKTGMFHKIFRSKSEDMLYEDISKNSSPKLDNKGSSMVEVILSPTLTRSLFTKSQSEDFLDKVIDRPNTRNYTLTDSQCQKELHSLKVKCPSLIKAFQSKVSDSSSLSTVFKKKIRLSKSHNFTTDDVPLPPRFCLEKRLSCQDLQAEICEKRYLTLERFPNGKETHFPAVVKTIKPLRKCESHRVYQVNKPKLLSNSDPLDIEVNGKYLHQMVVTNSIPDLSLSVNHGGPLTRKGKNESENSGIHNSSYACPAAFQTFSKKAPWFEKFKKSKFKMLCQENENPHVSEHLNSFGSPIYSNTLDSSSREVLRSSSLDQEQLDISVLSDCVNNLMKYKGQPEVHKRIAQKLTSVIHELEEEMHKTSFNDPYPASKISYQHDAVKKPYNPCLDQFSKVTNVSCPRPTSLSFGKEYKIKSRRNSAPMLSPIEEAKTSPSHDARPVITKSTTVSSPVPGIYRRNSAPLTLSVEGKMLSALQCRSLDKDNGVQKYIQMPNSVTKEVANTNVTTPLVLPAEDYKAQPCSPVHLAPITYCDDYGNDSEVEYV